MARGVVVLAAVVMLILKDDVLKSDGGYGDLMVLVTGMVRVLH